MQTCHVIYTLYPKSTGVSEKFIAYTIPKRKPLRTPIAIIKRRDDNEDRRDTAPLVDVVITDVGQSRVIRRGGTENVEEMEVVGETRVAWPIFARFSMVVMVARCPDMEVVYTIVVDKSTG